MVNQIQAEKVFTDKNWKLLDTYTNRRTKMKCVCPNNHIQYRSYRIMLDGWNCMKCTRNTQKLDSDYVKKYFDNENWKLLDNYENTAKKMKCSCPANHIQYKSFSHFQSGTRCMICSNMVKYEYTYVKQYIEDFNYILLNTVYRRATDNMDMICPENHTIKMSFVNFKQGKRCFECFGSKPNPNKSLNAKIRITHNKTWAKKHLTHDPLHQAYLQDPSKFHLDHIIPIDAFCKITLERGLDEIRVREIANHKRNIQILPLQENLTKNAKFDPIILEEYMVQYY